MTSCKTIPFGAVHTCVAYIGGVSLSPWCQSSLRVHLAIALKVHSSSENVTNDEINDQ